MQITWMDLLIKFLEESSTKLFRCFSSNLMKSNADKFHLLASINNTVNVIVEKFNIKISHCEKLLGVKFEHKLTLNSHIPDFSKKS